jgi:hypothetical protein
MSEDFENELRRALRRVDPPPGFAERVMRALPDQRPMATVTPIEVVRTTARASLWRRLSTPAALAASLVAAVLLGQHVATEQARKEQQAGLAASRELMQALRLTSQKLDDAYQAVQHTPAASADPEENPS